MSEPGIQTQHFLVYGKVQRVGFRNWAQTRATDAGLTGWVRNRPDGLVEIMASGWPYQLQAYKEVLTKGSAQADVARVQARTVLPKRFRSFRRKPTGPKTEQEITDIIPRLDPAYLAACQKTVDAMPRDRRLMTHFPQKQGRWRFGQIDAAAEKYGVDMVHLGPNAPPSLLCRTPGFTFGLDVSRPSWVNPVTEDLSNNKFLTKILLDGLGLPVLTGELCRTPTEAKAAFKKFNGAVVVKPVFGTEAKGVSLNISTPEACERAFAHALSENLRDMVLVEKYMPGVDLRLLMLGETMIAAYLRQPAHVVGDGVQSIADLVVEKNAARITLPSTKETHLLRLDIGQRRLLTLQGFMPADIPAPDKIVLLGVSPNYIDGADLVEISDCLHPDIVALAKQTAKAIDPTAFWGFDLLTEDFTASMRDAKTVICEVNSRPVGGVFRYATHGAHVLFYDALFETVLRTPSTFQAPKPAHATPLAEATSLDAIVSFKDQVAHIIQCNLPDAEPLNSNILVRRNALETVFLTLNPNPSFVRSALAPWRWMELRDVLIRNGFPVSDLCGASDNSVGNFVPLGRAFLTKPRNKMKTIRLETSDHLDQIRSDNPDWQITVERYEVPESAVVAVIGGRPITTTHLAEETPIKTKVDQDLLKICADLPNIIPGFTLGTVIFRPQANGIYAISEIRPQIDAQPFLNPDNGDPINLAQLQAEYALANPQTFSVALSEDLLRLSCQTKRSWNGPRK